MTPSRPNSHTDPDNASFPPKAESPVPGLHFQRPVRSGMHTPALAAARVPCGKFGQTLKKSRRSQAGRYGQKSIRSVSPSRMHAREPAALLSRSGAKFLWRRPSLFVPPILLGKPLPTMRRHDPEAVRSSLASGRRDPHGSFGGHHGSPPRPQICHLD